MKLKINIEKLYNLLTKPKNNFFSTPKIYKNIKKHRRGNSYNLTNLTEEITHMRKCRSQISVLDEGKDKEESNADSDRDHTQKTKKFNRASPEFKLILGQRDFDTTQKIKEVEVLDINEEPNETKKRSFSWIEKYNNDVKKLKLGYTGEMMDKSTQTEVITIHLRSGSRDAPKNQFNKTDSSFKRFMKSKSNSRFKRSKLHSSRLESSSTSKKRNFYQTVRLVPNQFIVDSPAKTMQNNGTKRMAKYLQSFGKCNNFNSDFKNSSNKKINDRANSKTFEFDGKNTESPGYFCSVQYPNKGKMLSFDLSSAKKMLDTQEIMEESFSRINPIEPTVYQSHNEHDFVSKRWKKNDRFSTAKRFIKQRKRQMMMDDERMRREAMDIEEDVMLEEKKDKVTDLRDYLKLTNIEEADYYANRSNLESPEREQRLDYGFSFKKSKDGFNSLKLVQSEIPQQPEYILIKPHNAKVSVNRHNKNRKEIRKFKLKNVLTREGLSNNANSGYTASLKRLMDEKASIKPKKRRKKGRNGHTSHRDGRKNSSSSFIKKNKEEVKRIRKFTKCDNCHKMYEKRHFRLHLTGKCVKDGPNFRGSSRKLKSKWC